MQRTILLLLGCYFQLTSISAQTAESDTIGFLHHETITYNWKNLERYKIHQGKFLLLQEHFEPGRLAREFIRYNDTTFLYTEYYEQPDTSVQYKGLTWGIKREGLVVISNQTTGTYSTFDPETYVEHINRDTLLLPFHQWTYYYPDGQKQTEGIYTNYKRQGNWKVYDKYGNLDQQIVYQNGVVQETTFINRIGAQSTAETSKSMQQIWLINDPALDGGYALAPKFKDYRFMHHVEYTGGAGDTYFFKEDNRLEYSKLKVLDTVYKQDDAGISATRIYDEVKSLHGKWKLINYHQVEVELEKEKVLFEIEYLSDKFLTLKKL